jgi:hypothetical protein
MKKEIAGFITLVFIAISAAQTPSPIEIVSPKAGEIYHVGDTVKVQWIIHGTRMPIAVLPLLSPDEGLFWLQLTTDGIRANNTTAYHDSVGTVYWVVTDTMLWTAVGRVKVCTVSENCQINIYLPYDEDMGSFLTGSFSIRQSTASINHPVYQNELVGKKAGWMIGNQHGINIPSVKIFQLNGQRSGQNHINQIKVYKP